MTPRDNPPPVSERKAFAVVAIDPGPEESAFVSLTRDGQIVNHGKVGNEAMLAYISGPNEGQLAATLVIEQIAAMGMSVGAEVFETVFWSGRFAERFGMCCVQRVKRHEVKMHLCGNTRAKDGNIRQALIDRYGPGKEKAIGRAKCPGPLYGISSDQLQALAVGLTWLDKQG